jgi:eukaryotic-like serine/threonine-protein kinase
MKDEDIQHAQALAEEFIASRGGGAISSKLGDGGSAVVFLWEHPSGLRALKVYDPKFFGSGAAPAERHRLDLQRRLIGRHCTSLVDTVSVEEASGTCFLTMEYFRGNELKKVVGRVPDAAVGPLIGQLVAAVRFLEGFGLVHRDIKPENILVSEDFAQLKLLDLGVVREISSDEDRIDGTDQGERRPFIATAQYSSPEYLFRLEAPSQDTWKALTLYQVGGVLHDLVCKRALFDRAVAADNKYALAMAVLSEAPSFEGASAAVAEWSALAVRCLAKQSAVRLKTVDWRDFDGVAASVADRLKRALAARAAHADRAIEAETRVQALHRGRLAYVEGFIEEVRRRIIAEYSPHVRVTLLARSEGRAGMLLTLSDEKLGVQLAFEFAWEEGIRERWATVRLAAQVAAEGQTSEFNGERRTIAEVEMEGATVAYALGAAFDASSEVLVKHSALVETQAVAIGMDMVAATWSV